MLRLVFFGDYDPDHPRTAVLLKGLSRLSVPVKEVNVRGFAKVLGLWRHVSALEGEYDVVVVPECPSRWMPVLAAMASPKPVVWLPDVSQYDIAVNDRPVPKRTFATFLTWLREWTLLLGADLVVLPTRASADFFARSYGAPPQKFAWVFPGADDEAFAGATGSGANGTFDIECHGAFSASGGAEMLAHAAKFLADDPAIHFTLVGQEREEPVMKRVRMLVTEASLANVTQLPFVQKDEITKRIAEAEVTIGLLGTNVHGERVLPERVFEAAAAKRVVLSVASPALLEAFVPDEQFVAVRPDDPEDVAAKLRALKADPVRQRAIAEAAYQRYSAVGTPEAVARRLVEAIEGIRG